VSAALADAPVLAGLAPVVGRAPRLLYDQALLAEGGHLEDPAGFVKRLNDMLLAMSLR
jgi:HSP90 family molecular chaperone